jgi:hypothetical protein
MAEIGLLSSVMLSAFVYGSFNDAVNSLDQWYSALYVRVPPDAIYLQLCAPKVVGV